MKTRLKLGPPGVRVVAEAMPGVEVLPGATNRVFVAGTNSIPLPARVLEFTSQVRPVDKVVYDWLPKDTTYGQAALRGAGRLSGAQSRGPHGHDRTSMHQPQACLPGSGWRIESTEQFALEMDRPQPYRLPSGN